VTFHTSNSTQLVRPNLKPVLAIWERYTGIVATVILRNQTKREASKGDEKRVQTISLKAKNDGAERLWNYILTYREIRNKEQEASEKEPQDDGITFFVPPPLNLVKTSRNKKRTQR